MNDPESSYRCIYTPVLQEFAFVARDKNGCQVVQECIKMSTSEQRKEIVAAIVNNIESLINDDYGNFVVK